MLTKRMHWAKETIYDVSLVRGQMDVEVLKRWGVARNRRCVFFFFFLRGKGLTSGIFRRPRLIKITKKESPRTASRAHERQASSEVNVRRCKSKCEKTQANADAAIEEKIAGWRLKKVRLCHIEIDIRYTVMKQLSIQFSQWFKTFLPYLIREK